MGSLGLQASGPLIHIFVLRNDTQVPLTLDHLQPSCPCTLAFVLAEAGGTPPTAIRPGQTFSVQVSVNPQKLSPGLLHKSVWVFVKGQDAPAATLEMTGALLPSASFSPPSLAFGQIEKGTELTLLLKATLQPERLEQGTELRLISPDPDVQVTTVVPDSPTGGAIPEEAGQATRAFRIRLAPHAHIGRLQGKLSLVLAHMGDPPAATGPVVDTVSWRAEAEGDISASPSVIAFGVTPAGQTLTRRVLLTGKGLGGDVQALKPSSTSPYLTVSLKPAPKSLNTKPRHTKPENKPADQAKSADQVEMDVRLDPRAPAGPLDARLMVTTPGGEQLVLPAFAVVQPVASAAKALPASKP